ncbi:hypothetical protein J6590_106856, partial [Homalodisca vitripennis]
ARPELGLGSLTILTQPGLSSGLGFKVLNEVSLAGGSYLKILTHPQNTPLWEGEEE